MNCCKPIDYHKRHSLTLDKEIASWMKQYRKTIKFLLLGAGESGKTTILKQMKILHIQGFSESERREKAENIRRNILQAIKELTENMSLLAPPETIDYSPNKESFDYIQKITLSDEHFDYTQDFYNHVAKLWADDGVQKCYHRRNEFALIDCAKYFLDKIDTIRKEDYIPNDKDILHCRKRTSDIQKIEFTVPVPKKYGGGEQCLWMFDVGGQRGERRKWIQVFHGITAILFLVATCGFDSKLREDKETNRLRESLKIFNEAWGSRFLSESGFILFLNKQDVLEEKISRGARIEDYFEEYRSYTPSDADCSNEYHKARCFIKDLFLADAKKPIITDSLARVRGSDAFEHQYSRNMKKRDCYWHYTTATDTENVKRVFNDVHTMIIMTNLDAVVPS